MWVSTERVQNKESEGREESRRAHRLPAAREMMLPLLRRRKTQGRSRMALVMFERPVRHPSGDIRWTVGVSLGPGLQVHIWESSDVAGSWSHGTIQGQLVR